MCFGWGSHRGHERDVAQRPFQATQFPAVGHLAGFQRNGVQPRAGCQPGLVVAFRVGCDIKGVGFGSVHTQFAHGLLSLADRARAETLYTTCCRALRKQLNSANRAHREIIDELNEKLAEKLFVNFSLFQALPDVWGIDQIFPIMPVNGLNRPLTRRAVIQDITCDSDGRIDRYVDGQGIETTFPLPEEAPEEPMLMGFFMTGAYLEILGDMLTLFGDTPSVDVRRNPGGGHTVSEPIHGDTVAKVLQYVNFEPTALLRAYQQKFAASGLPEDIQTSLLEELENGLGGYTYLEE